MYNVHIIVYGSVASWGSLTLKRLQSPEGSDVVLLCCCAVECSCHYLYHWGPSVAFQSHSVTQTTAS